MILSTQTDRLFNTFPEEQALKIFADAGYDAVDYSMFAMTNDSCPLNTCDIPSYAAELRGMAKAVGLTFNQAHAPFPCWRRGDDAYNEKMPERVERSVKIAGLLGAKSIVVHPIAYGAPEEEQKAFNLAFYKKLEPVALEYGVKVALENMWGRDGRRNYIVANVCSWAKDLCDYYDALDNPEAFTVCLDLGHCGLIGEEPDEAIRILGRDRLGALHVHDNDYVSDAHTMPYDYGMKMNWNAITTALGEIDYQGDFTFEADAFLRRYDAETIPAAVNYMAAIGRCLIAKVDAARP